MWKSNKARWLISHQHPLESSEQAYTALECGYTLINNQGFTVSYNDSDEQLISNLNRKRPYAFSHPELWQILHSNEKKIINPQSIGYKVSVMLIKIMQRMF